MNFMPKKAIFVDFPSYLSQQKLKNKRRQALAKILTAARRKGVSQNDIIQALSVHAKETYIPLSIFCQEALTQLETVVKYLKEEERLTNAEIAENLHVSQQTIWYTYQKAKEKMPQRHVATESIILPLSVFLPELSVFESIVFYLKKIGKTYREIATLLARNERTVWTVFARAQKKAPAPTELREVPSYIDHVSQQKSIRKLERIVSQIQRYKLHEHLSQEELLELLSEKSILPEIIPISIFHNENLTPFEAIVKYFKEEETLSLTKISQILNKSSQTIWFTYHAALQKMPDRLEIEPCQALPIRIFQNTKNTIAGAVVAELRRSGMRYCDIARALNRDERTVWTIYSRVKP
jgi:DNA-binding CsgD family transcriptional regulator